MSRLKKEMWQINTKGSGGPNANTDVAFGINDDNKPALRLGENVITGDPTPIPESKMVWVTLTAEEAEANGDGEITFFNPQIDLTFAEIMAIRDTKMVFCKFDDVVEIVYDSNDLPDRIDLHLNAGLVATTTVLTGTEGSSVIYFGSSDMYNNNMLCCFKVELYEDGTINAFAKIPSTVT